jgi:hypothetical protein
MSVSGFAKGRTLRLACAILLALAIASTPIMGSPQAVVARSSNWSTPVAISAAGSELHGMAAPVALSDGRILTVTLENRLVGELYRYFIVAYLTNPQGVTTESILAGPGDENTFRRDLEVIAGPDGTAAATWVLNGTAQYPDRFLAFFNSDSWRPPEVVQVNNNFRLWNTSRGIRIQVWTYVQNGDKPREVTVTAKFYAPEADAGWRVLAERPFLMKDYVFLDPAETLLDSASLLGLGFATPTTSETGTTWQLGVRFARYVNGGWVTSEEEVVTQQGMDVVGPYFSGDLSATMDATWSYSNGREQVTESALRIDGRWTSSEFLAESCVGSSSGASRLELDAPGGPIKRCLTYNPSSRMTTLQRVQFTDQGPIFAPDVPIPTPGRWTFCEVLRATNVTSPDVCLLNWDTSFVGMVGQSVPGGFNWVAAPSQAIALYALPGKAYAAIGSQYPFDQQRPTTTPITYSRLQAPSPTPPSPPRELKVTAGSGRSVSATWSPSDSTPGMQYEYRLRWGKQPFSPWKMTSRTSVRLTDPGKSPAVTVQVRSRINGLTSTPASRSIRLP